MPSNHPATTALPAVGNPDKTLLRNLLTGFSALTLADAATAADLVAQDPITGALGLDILCGGRLFHLDLLDSTSAHDGVTVLVTSDGYRYKLASQTDVMVWAALSKSLATPPASPSNGDSYLVPAGATGAWAGKANYVAVKTTRGWEFIIFGIGRLLYVEDIDTYYRRNAAGTWVAGLGASALGANSVNILNVLGANASFSIKVENQTTNAPPASPTAPTAYIIGPSPSGAWVGNAGKLAICLVNGNFTIITPVDGDQVYDKATQSFYTFRGSSWQVEAGAWVAFRSQFTAASMASVTTTGGAAYGYSDTTAPTASNVGYIDGVTISHAARKAGALLRFRYTARFNLGTISSGSDAYCTVALFYDSVAAALAWEIQPTVKVGGSGGATLRIAANFVVPALDASAHTYQIRILQGSGSPGFAGMDRRLFTLEEASS